MTINSFQIEIKDGKIIFKSDHHRDLFKKWIFQFSDGVYFLEINQRKSKRTDQQNRYYWLYLSIVSRETGDTPEDLHELFKRKFLKKEIKEVFGEVIEIIGSTTNQKVSEFIEYLMKIENLTGYQLPDTTEFFGYSYHK